MITTLVKKNIYNKNTNLNKTYALYKKCFLSSASNFHQTVYSPAVNRLLLENNLLNEKADAIPKTGPKGNLLKGDVLKFLLQGGTLNVGDIPINVFYFQKSINFFKLRNWSTKNGYTFHEGFVKLITVILQKFPEFLINNAKAIHVTKLTTSGLSKTTFAIPEKNEKITKNKFLSWIKPKSATFDDYSPKTPVSFCFYDQSNSNSNPLYPLVTAANPFILNCLKTENVNINSNDKLNFLFEKSKKHSDSNNTYLKLNLSETFDNILFKKSSQKNFKNVKTSELECAAFENEKFLLDVEFSFDLNKLSERKFKIFLTHLEEHAMNPELLL